MQQLLPEVHSQVVFFHLGFNVALAILFIGFTGLVGRRSSAGCASRRRAPTTPAAPPRSAGADDAIARDLVRRARGAAPGRRGRDHAARHRPRDPQQRPALSSELRKLDDVVDELYSAIKFYLTQISGEALSKEETRRWTDIVSFTINMEQIGDIIERVLQDIEDKKVKKSRSFSDAGMAEIVHLHERLLSNLRLAMSVFLDGHVRDAKRLLEEKAHFRDLEHEYAANHIAGCATTRRRASRRARSTST
jgi:phosphate:Na+ symporter